MSTAARPPCELRAAAPTRRSQRWRRRRCATRWGRRRGAPPSRRGPRGARRAARPPLGLEQGSRRLGAGVLPKRSGPRVPGRLLRRAVPPITSRPLAPERRLEASFGEPVRPGSRVGEGRAQQREPLGRRSSRACLAATTFGSPAKVTEALRTAAPAEVRRMPKRSRCSIVIRANEGDFAPPSSAAAQNSRSCAAMLARRLHLSAAPVLRRLSTKSSTGIVGMEVRADAPEILLSLYSKTLAELESLPAEAGYRSAVEALTKGRMAAVEGAKSIEEIGRHRRGVGRAAHPAGGARAAADPDDARRCGGRWCSSRRSSPRSPPSEAARRRAAARRHPHAAVARLPDGGAGRPRRAGAPRARRQVGRRRARPVQ